MTEAYERALDKFWKHHVCHHIMESTSYCGRKMKLSRRALFCGVAAVAIAPALPALPVPQDDALRAAVIELWTLICQAERDHHARADDFAMAA